MVKISAVLEHTLARFFTQFPNISQKGVIIMSTGVGNAIVGIVVRLMRIVTIRKKTELENPHSREPAIFYEVNNLFGNVT